MKDEGLAREVINLVQKLRKEGKVTPSDAVTLYYKVFEVFCNCLVVTQVIILFLSRPQIQPENSNVARVVNAYSNFIENAIKVPWRPLSSRQTRSNEIITKSQEVCFQSVNWREPIEDMSVSTSYSSKMENWT